MSYDSDDLSTRLSIACTAYKERPNAKIAPIVGEFDITARQLRYRLKNGLNLPGAGGANRLLSHHQELAVCAWLHRLAQLKIDARIPILRGCANAILRLSYLNFTTPPLTVGNY